MAKTTSNQFTVTQLKRALKIKEQIERLENKLASLLGSSESASDGKVVRRRRRMSAAGRARISAAAKARWARQRALKAKKA